MTKKFILALLLTANLASKAQHVSCGRSHTLVLCPNGDVQSFGGNEFGQLGDGTTIDKKLPVTLNGLSNVIKVVAGPSNSYFIKSDGSVWGCGRNILGQLGSSGAITSIPTLISSISNVKDVAVGNNHVLFLKTDSTAWAMGDNTSGQLGIGQGPSAHNYAMSVSGLGKVIAIAASGDHSLFVQADGTVWGCGINNSNCLTYVAGSGFIGSPVQLSGLSGIKSVASGSDHSLFLKNNGKVFSCGTNEQGQIGLYYTNFSSSYATEIYGLANVKAIATYNNHSVILKNDSTVWSFGRNVHGQAGIGTSGGGYGLYNPTKINTLSGITEVSAGYEHTFFYHSNGTISATGYNANGQLGDGSTTEMHTPFQLTSTCIVPTPPAVNFSNFPTSLCLGGSVNAEPSVAGSNPELTVLVDNSIAVNSPKAITKNSQNVFVLEGNDQIKRFGLDGGLQYTYNSGTPLVPGIVTMSADENNNVWVTNGDGRVYRLGTAGDSSSVAASVLSNQVVATGFAPYTWGPEKFFVLDTNFLGLSSIDVANSNPFTNNQPQINTLTDVNRMMSMSFDNFYYAEKRMLLADPYNNKLWSRKILDYTQQSNVDPQLLIDSTLTAGMALDFVDADTINRVICTSSSATATLGLLTPVSLPDGTHDTYLDTSFTSLVNAQIPVGMISASGTSVPQFWIADKGQNKLLRATFAMYQVTPPLPPGLRFNPNTGGITGTPLATAPAQTYTITIINALDTSTCNFTFGVTPTAALNNTPGTSTGSGTQGDGLSLKYFTTNNCEKLIEIADSIGGTSPGEVQVEQDVLPIVGVIANDTMIRRITKITAENPDAPATIKLFYTYQDIQLFNQSHVSPLLSNDTTGGTMQMAILQMHTKPDNSKEPIIHSPVTANWSHADHNWVVSFQVSKFSEFYGGDIGTLGSFDCSNIGYDTLNFSTGYYVWNYDSLFTSGDYTDTLINVTGCDSIVMLNLTLNPVGLSESAIGSHVTIFPNPGNGVFNISIQNNAVDPTRVRVLNLLGKEVYNKAYVPGAAIDISSAEAGVYFIILQTADKPMIWKVMKE